MIEIICISKIPCGLYVYELLWFTNDLWYCYVIDSYFFCIENASKMVSNFPCNYLFTNTSHAISPCLNSHECIAVQIVRNITMHVLCRNVGLSVVG